MPYPKLGQPLPRAADAYVGSEKWHGWILAARGHGSEWAHVFAVGPDDRERVWQHGLMVVVHEIAVFDRVELVESVGDAPAGARGGVLELPDGGVAMVEITAPKLDPASRIIFAPISKLRRLG